MPEVATIEKPSSTNRARPRGAPTALSRSASEKNTVPEVGIRSPAASCDLANAMPTVVSMPMTSPVERISGPSTASTSGKRLQGSTASLTAMWSPVDLRAPAGPRSRSSSSVAPHMTRAATFTSGTPVALATNGTVREARGLASITNTWPVPGSPPDALHRELHVDEAADVERLGDAAGVVLDDRDGGVGQARPAG